MKPRFRHWSLLSAVLLIALVSLLLLRSGSFLVEAFVSPGAITIDGSFADWGSVAAPTAGVTVQQDLSNTGSQDGSGFDGKAADMTYAWVGASTQLGGTTPPSPSNLIQNFYYRIDTACDTGPGFCGQSGSWVLNQAYNIQLNLGVAPAGFADHLLQIFPQTAASTPQVVIILFAYATPYPAVAAFTTGTITGLVSNVASPYPTFTGVIDAAAVGAVGLVGGTYSIEVRIPASWFTAAYGGAVALDSCTTSIVSSTVFTSTGGLGAVGTVKDTVNQPGGPPISIITDLCGIISATATATATPTPVTGQPPPATSTPTQTPTLQAGLTPAATATRTVTLTATSTATPTKVPTPRPNVGAFLEGASGTERNLQRGGVTSDPRNTLQPVPAQAQVAGVTETQSVGQLRPPNTGDAGLVRD